MLSMLNLWNILKEQINQEFSDIYGALGVLQL